MSELISGKEALIALANGSVVQGNIGFGWIDIDINDDILLNSFITERNRDGIAVKFRLKPRTITINGIEVPAPFKPTEDCLAFIIDDGKTDGWKAYGYEVDGDATSQFLGLWRTEDEIKQVVVALRKIFVINNQ